MARENKTEGIQDWKIPTGWKYGPYRHTRGISFPPLKKDPATFQPLICTNTSPIVGHFRPLNLRTKIIALTGNEKSKNHPETNKLEEKDTMSFSFLVILALRAV